ncbi:Uracil-DNA glycosylase [Sanguibacter gelidistatuariae]|uniref:Uracil-DNA glycosylase n=1 Tax=Sanguibacter gelidistatuariae TaxID=1814289 RepID=A0A1G6PRR0_9MICO|nr:uracil-DNA glycosylase [Sanguibacter gelidistatuariae]SDC82900.1 Uracil-DNA glycosylase [Sanguibacter gelidistatuariae]
MLLLDSVAPDWAAALAPVASLIDDLDARLLRPADNTDSSAAVAAHVAAQAAGRTATAPTVLPERAAVLRAFREPLARVRVLVVGQDPYPTPGHAMGLSFSVQPHVRPLPRSLQNIFTELRDDVGAPAPATGDLTAWADQGVMLCNRVLTVAAGDAGSHRGLGWEAVTDHAIAALVARGGPLVAVLWGRDAQSLAPALAGVPIIASAHPSPLSARRGFFGSRPFSRVNELLVAQGAAPVDWTLPAAPRVEPADLLF